MRKDKGGIGLNYHPACGEGEVVMMMVMMMIMVINGNGHRCWWMR